MAHKIQIVEGSLPCTLGEGPHWDPIKQELFYVDILGQGVLRYVPKTKEGYRVPIEGTVSLIVPVENEPNKYIIGVGRELKVLEWDGKSSTPTSLKTLSTVDEEAKFLTNRLNDGKCDSRGRLWAGTMGHYNQGTMEIVPKNGNLFSLTGNKLQKHFGSIDISNGLCWSADDKMMYYIDSFKYNVEAYDYDLETGSLSNCRVAFDFKEEGVDGVPDGMTIDSDGNLWIAVFNGSKVIQVDPKTRKMLREVAIPTKMVTSVAFGGPNLDILYVVTACNFKDGKPIKEAGAGEVYEITNLGVKGLSGGVNFRMSN